jgi:hypothetical protein
MPPTMIRARIEHTFNCSAETYWEKVFFSEEYNRRMFLEALEFEGWNQVKFQDTGNRIDRIVDAKPKMMDLPGPLKRVAEKGLGYREISSFDKQSRVLTTEVEPESLKGKLFIKGEIRCEPSGENKCRRIYDANIEAKVFGVGGMIERRLLADIEQSYDKAAKFTNQFLAEKGY